VDVTHVETKNLNSLEDYAISLAYGMISLKTLENLHIKAIDIGILTEDLSCRANTIIWDIRRDIRLYQEQLESVLELVPDDKLDVDKIIEHMKPKRKKRCVT